MRQQQEEIKGHRWPLNRLTLVVPGLQLAVVEVNGGDCSGHWALMMWPERGEGHTEARWPLNYHAAGSGSLAGRGMSNQGLYRFNSQTII